MQNMGEGRGPKSWIQHLASHSLLIQIQPLLHVVVGNVANINYFILSLVMFGSGPPNTRSWSHEII